jgi:hypothetical protein
MFFNSRTQVSFRIGQSQSFAAKLNVSGISAFKANPFAAKPDFRISLPIDGMTQPGLQPLELRLQPDVVARDELARGGLRGASGNCHARNTIRSQTQQVTPGARMANHQQGHLAGANP